MNAMRWKAMALAVLSVSVSMLAADSAAMAKQYAESGDSGAEKELRGQGTAAVPALREIKPDGDTATARVRNLLTDILLENTKIDPDGARVMHEVAREEGIGKRYTNAERLYRRCEQLYDTLKDDADSRKDKIKSKEYSDKQRVCDRMKDKAGHKAKGEAHTGLNLGFVRVGKDHDMSDDWE
jgi:hypothetical protein